MMEEAMNKDKKIVRIVALALAGLMLAGVVTGVITVLVR
jgi:hypothetical protein